MCPGLGVVVSGWAPSPQNGSLSVCNLWGVSLLHDLNRLCVVQPPPVPLSIFFQLQTLSKRIDDKLTGRMGTEHRQGSMRAFGKLLFLKTANSTGNIFFVHVHHFLLYRRVQHFVLHAACAAEL